MPFDYNQDPTTFLPETDPITGIREQWGIVGAIDDTTQETAMISLMERMNQLHTSQTNPNASPFAEARFVTALKDAKIAELQKYERESGKIPCKQDYIFDVVFSQCEDPRTGEPLVKRQFRCSGDLNLRTWVDKVLIPVVGYARGHHGWVLNDQKDGAVFAPSMQTIDSMHMWNHGLKYIDDIDYTVAHVLRNEGDAMGWCYDLGDQYRHLITVKRVLPASESTSKIELISGSGAAPAEDHKGNRGWKKLVDSIFRSSAPLSVHAEVRNSQNYKNILHLLQLPNPNRWRLDPLLFYIEEARFTMEFAWETKLVDENNMGANTGLMAALMGGQRMNHKKQGLSAEKKRESAVCGGCGKPNYKDEGEAGKLKKCAGCRVAWYCGAECQKRKWPTHKQYCKTLKEERKNPFA